RPRRLERRRDQARDHARRRQGRQEALAADGLRLVRAHDRAGPRRDRRLPADRAAFGMSALSPGDAGFLRRRRGLPDLRDQVRILHRGAADRAVEPRQRPGIILWIGLELRAVARRALRADLADAELHASLSGMSSEGSKTAIAARGIMTAFLIAFICSRNH